MPKKESTIKNVGVGLQAPEGVLRKADSIQEEADPSVEQQRQREAEERSALAEDIDKARTIIAGIRNEAAVFSSSPTRVAACDQLTTILDAIDRRVLDPKDNKETTP